MKSLLRYPGSKWNLAKSIESRLSEFGILELISETESNRFQFPKYQIAYSLSLTDVISDYGELGDIDIDVYYDDHQKITYELGKYSLPFFINSKSNLKRFLDLLIDLPLVLTVSYEKIAAVDWDRYSISITGAETTSLTELVSMIEVFKQFLLQVSHEQLDSLPKRWKKIVLVDVQNDKD